MTGRNKVLLLVLSALFLGNVQTRVFSRPELARALYNYGFPEYQLNDWVCLVESESSRDTSAVQGPNTDGSYDYGLFQINSEYWCGISARGGVCNVKCSELLSSSIGTAVECAKIIYGRDGFEAWEGWKKRCRNKALPDVTQYLHEPRLTESLMYSAHRC